MLDKQIQDIMFEVFTYAAITDGIMSSEGDRRTAQREEMREQDLKIRSMLLSLAKGCEHDHR